MGTVAIISNKNKSNNGSSFPVPNLAIMRTIVFSTALVGLLLLTAHHLKPAEAAAAVNEDDDVIVDDLQKALVDEQGDSGPSDLGESEISDIGVPASGIAKSWSAFRVAF